MRLIVVWPTPTPEVKVLLDELRSQGHEIVYWVGEHPVAHLTPQGTIFHDHYDAWDGKPAAVFQSTVFGAAPAELIERMYRSESIVLTMMNKHFDTAPVDERKHIYYGMLAYWNFVLDQVKPDYVVFSSIPHTVYNYVLYELARLRGLRTLSFEDTWLATRLITYSDFWSGSEKLQHELKQLQSTDVSADELVDDELKGFWLEHTRPDSRVAPPYMAYQKSTAVGWGLWKHRVRIVFSALRAGRLFPLVRGYLRRYRGGNLQKEYARIVRPVDWSVPYVYFPLHFQPERTTSPQGSMYHDQLLVAETIAAALTDGWRLYIKEHPTQWWLRGKERYSSARYRGYYERLAKIPHTQLIPVATDTFELTERSQTVAVITGTAGWEALLRGKRPLVFGLPWYRDFPGLFRTHSVETCADALSEVQRGAHTTKVELLRYLKALEKATIRAYLGDPLENRPRYTAEENMRTIADAITVSLRDS